jgi:hypothetical protein
MEITDPTLLRDGGISCRVVATIGTLRYPLTNAKIRVYGPFVLGPNGKEPHWDHKCRDKLAAEGYSPADEPWVCHGLRAGHYFVECAHYPVTPPVCVYVSADGGIHDVHIIKNLVVSVSMEYKDQQGNSVSEGRQYQRVLYDFQFKDPELRDALRIQPPPGFDLSEESEHIRCSGTLERAGEQIIPLVVQTPEFDKSQHLVEGRHALVRMNSAAKALEIPPTERVEKPVSASLRRTATEFTKDLSFWQHILACTERLGFAHYEAFMDDMFRAGEYVGADKESEKYARKLARHRFLPFTDMEAYRLVKVATEAFVMVNCGVMGNPQPGKRESRAYFERRDLPYRSQLPEIFDRDYLEPIRGGSPEARTLPYLAVIRRKLPDIAIKMHTANGTDDADASEYYGIIQKKLLHPCLLELIWSYWHEEGMLVQTMNAVARRFQNLRAPGASDPLANLEIDPLRPLNSLLWGYIQDEQHQLSVVRRNYEYDHHYGLRLQGKAVQKTAPADSRSKFLESFHNLLRQCAAFFKQDDDTTVKADAFPVLNALKEVHLILSEGAHGQFGDLPSTARVEMLMQQWFLARPEFREFLPTRVMVAYPEPWMDRVDAMKKLQSWTDTSVLHFRNLALFGEQVLLSVRWGNWNDVQEPLDAFNWARFFRPQIQGYIHAYRSVTGVDLTENGVPVDATLPSVLLQKQLLIQHRA